MFCVRPRTILMGEKNVTRGVLEGLAKLSIPKVSGCISNGISLC